MLDEDGIGEENCRLRGRPRIEILAGDFLPRGEGVGGNDPRVDSVAGEGDGPGEEEGGGGSTKSRSESGSVIPGSVNLGAASLGGVRKELGLRNWRRATALRGARRTEGVGGLGGVGRSEGAGRLEAATLGG